MSPGKITQCSFAMVHLVSCKISWDISLLNCVHLEGNRIERCLSYDEKPLLLFQKLKDSNRNPVFMLKHIKEIRSPIAVAQQKHAARKAPSVISNDTVATQGHHLAGKANSTPRFEVSDLSTTSGSASTTLPSWPEAGLPSSLADQRKEDLATPPSSSTLKATSSASENTLMVPGSSPQSRISEKQQSNHPNPASIPTPHGQVSYAIAIYPYMAEQEDEFDVVV